MIAPTKSNLLKSKKSLKIAKQGYTLLEKKRNVLILEMMKMLPAIRKLQKEFFESFREAYSSLQAAAISHGMKNLKDLTMNCGGNLPLKITQKSVMGNAIPAIAAMDEKPNLSYSIINSNTQLDEAAKKFRNAISLSLKVAEMQATVVKIVKDIKKTQKRVNALDYILIPQYNDQIKFIVSSIEEKERSEFFKVKMLKHKKND